MVQRLVDLKDLADQTISTTFVDKPKASISMTTFESTWSLPVPSASIIPPKVLKNDLFDGSTIYRRKPAPTSLLEYKLIWPHPGLSTRQRCPTRF
ncbi:hypothetical protein AX14_002421 [Amanita brunnescens Koide BX004]|nr:hypothetical protein AX14_002421 [Amanita brunnescens Koide BX004]